MKSPSASTGADCQAFCRRSLRDLQIRLQQTISAKPTPRYLLILSRFLEVLVRNLIVDVCCLLEVLSLLHQISFRADEIATLCNQTIINLLMTFTV
ncbi:hypothetical protein DY000_02038405 [Brassica cretica]|uniref:Uncharacterized protein n=1 Tax=Brassica cretica TaxID=69181 RepID=A0ABQ7BFK5_BRACR|nr:hypothetical protein DY000_02038405 [Brassica cretica]